jgi:predicted esterase
MLGMNTNEIIIDKHSSSIQISNKISTIQRKSYNYMLKIAKNEFKQDKNRRIFTITADELLLFFGMGGDNHTHLKKELELLNKTIVSYNILGKDRKKGRWGSFSLIAGFEYNNGIIEYSFPHQIINMLLESLKLAQNKQCSSCNYN